MKATAGSLRRQIVLLYMCLAAWCLVAMPGRAETRILAGSTPALQYLVQLPLDYFLDPLAAWPLLIFLHGAWERGDCLWAVTAHGPPQIAPTRSEAGHDSWTQTYEGRELYDWFLAHALDNAPAAM